MNLTYRQGLISYQQPTFLVPSATANFVDISVSPTPLYFTIAHGSSDYLFKVDETIDAAFGPLVPGVDNYLYINLNVISGALTYGISTLEPIVSTQTPSAPVASQMWFDLNEKVMKVRNADNTKWIVTPRLVVGIASNGSTNLLTAYTAGTSTVGLYEASEPGYLMFDSQLRPLRTSTGELLTSQTAVRVKSTVGSAGVLSEPINNFIPVRASEAIPAMSLVYISGENTVGLASSNPAILGEKTPIGIVELGLAQNEIGVMTQVGEITYDQWNWDPSLFGKPLYCDYTGGLTSTRPASVQAYRVGYIKNANTILFSIDSETQAQVVASNGSIISGVAPIQAVTALNSASEIVTTISMPPAATYQDGYMTQAQAATLESFDARVTTAEANITDLQTSKANVVHSHAISDVAGLQAALDVIPTKMDKVTGGVAGDFVALGSDGNAVDSGFSAASFAAASHTQAIATITGLQDALDLKSAVGHVHSIADVTGLQTELDNRAYVNHTQAISTITGLQTALSNKADVGHSHVITDVSGLQAALDDKAPLVHTHVVSDVANLQTLLDGKANLTHSHAISDVTGLQAALDSKAPIIHVHSPADIIGGSVGQVIVSDGTAGTWSTLSVEGAIPAGTVQQYYRGDKTWATLDKAAVGLDQVDNTSDLAKPISTATQAALDLKAAVGHTHTAAEITDFSSAVITEIDTYVAAGTGITLDNSSGSLVISTSAAATIFQPVQAVTTENVDFQNPPALIDGIQVVQPARVLVQAQTNAAENGIYQVSDGFWIRAFDLQNGATVPRGALIYSTGGDLYSNALFSFNATKWLVGPSEAIVGTDDLQFVPVVTTGITSSALDIGRGGTGATTQIGARTNLLPAQGANANTFLKTDGTDVSWSSISTADLSNFDAASYDRLKSMLAAGSSITLTPDDANSKITVAATVTTPEISDFADGVYAQLEADIVRGSKLTIVTDAPNRKITIGVDPAAFAPVATSGSYADLTNTPTLATVATSGSYTDLLNQPTIPSFAVDQTRWVSKGGSDVTGTGTIDKPFLTIESALNSITDSAVNKPYCIFILPGFYVETNIKLKPFVSLFGIGIDAVRVAVTDSLNMVTVDPTAGWNQALGRVSISNIYFRGSDNGVDSNNNPTGLSLDFGDLTGATPLSAVIDLNNVCVLGTTHIGGRPDGNDFIEGGANCVFWGGVSVQDANLSFVGSQLYGGLSLVNSAATIQVNATLLSSYLYDYNGGSSVTLSGNSMIELYNTYSDAGVDFSITDGVLKVDASSYPNSTPTITGTGVVTKVSSARGFVETLVQVVAAPATATSTGTVGQIAYDASYLYVCTATNTWVRTPIATW